MTYRRNDSYARGNLLSYYCSFCNVELTYTCKSVNDSVTYDELLIVKIEVANITESIDSKIREFLSFTEKLEDLKLIRVKSTSLYRLKMKRVRKFTVLQYYSNGVIQCSCCGEMMWEFLTIDHIKGRKSMNHDKSMSGDKLYRWIITSNFPEGFQVYCFNCNLAKSSNEFCPHIMHDKTEYKITIDSLVSS